VRPQGISTFTTFEATGARTGVLQWTGDISVNAARGITPAALPSAITISSTKPESVTIVRGGSAQSVAVNLTRRNYARSITLSTSTLPRGVSSTFTEPGTAKSGSISLKAASNAPAVTNQTITITASGSGVASVTATFSLTVQFAEPL
jgi:hypothetical protein